MSKRDLTPEDLFIPKPCSVELDPSTVGRKKRYCSECRQHVWDLSKMTRAEVDALLERDDVCVMTTFEGDELRLAESANEEPESLFWGAIGGAVAAGVAWMAISTFASGAEPERFDLDSLPDVPAQVAPLVPEAPEVAEVDVPEHLAEAERQYIYRLKTEYGISVEGDRTLQRPKERARSQKVTLRDALEDLEVIQQKRDQRTGSKSKPITKKTYREVIEDLEVIQYNSRFRRTRGKLRKRPNRAGITIISAESNE